MSDTTTSPNQGTVELTPMSFDQGVEAIAGLLNDDPEEDHVKADMANAGHAEASDLVTVEGDDELVLDDGELEAAAETAAEAPPATISDDFEITLDDGQKISLGELKRNNLYQRDYTRKTTALKEHEKSLEEQYQKRVSDAENEIRQRRDFILNYAQRFMPRQPNPAMMDETSPHYDPIGYLHEQKRYEAEVQEFNAIVQQRDKELSEAQRRQQEMLQEALTQEQTKLFQAMPKLKDEKARKAFFDEAVDIGGSTYGITPDEVKQIGDHRYMRILHDAIQYRKAVAKAAAVKKELAAKPKLEQRQRMPQGAVQDRDRQGRFSTHRQTGSIDSAAKAIEALL